MVSQGGGRRQSRLRGQLGIMRRTGYRRARPTPPTLRPYEKAVAQGFRPGGGKAWGSLSEPDPGWRKTRTRHSPLPQRRQSGDPAGERALGDAYRLGIGVGGRSCRGRDLVAARGRSGRCRGRIPAGDAVRRTQVGYPNDRMQSWFYLLRAANHGHTVAAALVGTGYMTGQYGPERDHQKAAYWLNVAVEQDGRRSRAHVGPLTGAGSGTDLARFELGLLLSKGDGIASDPPAPQS